jgi:hypothetical protein
MSELQPSNESGLDQIPPRRRRLGPIRVSFLVGVVAGAMNYALIAILLHSIVYLPFYLAMYLVAGAGVGILTGVVVTVANALLVGRLKPGHRFGLALRAAVAFVFFVGGWLLLATSFSPDLRIPTSVVGVLAGASVAAVISRNSVPASSASHD